MIQQPRCSSVRRRSASAVMTLVALLYVICASLFIKQQETDLDATADYSFLYSAYLTRHSAEANSWSLRILFLALCDRRRRPRHIWQVAIADANTTGTAIVRLKGKASSIHANCPWHSNCNYVGFEWKSGTFSMDSDRLDVENVQLKITNNETERSVTLRNVILLQDQDQPIYNLSVCVQPMFLYQDAYQLVHFVELWRQLGADHFYIYHQSSTDRVRRILAAYEEAHIVTVVPWPQLPVINEFNPNNYVYRTEVFTAIQDCLLRSRATSEFVAFVDLDEVIVPTAVPRNVYQFVKQFEKTFNKSEDDDQLATVMFRSSLAHVNSDINEDLHSTFGFRMFLNVRSTTILLNMLIRLKCSFAHQPGKMSKLVVRPKLIELIHVHQVLNFVRKGDRHHIVPLEIARVWHMRTVAKSADHRFDKNGTLMRTTDLASVAAAAESALGQRARIAPLLSAEADHGCAAAAAVAANMQRCLDDLQQAALDYGSCPAAASKCAGHIRDPATGATTTSLPRLNKGEPSQVWQMLL